MAAKGFRVEIIEIHRNLSYFKMIDIPMFQPGKRIREKRKKDETNASAFQCHNDRA